MTEPSPLYFEALEDSKRFQARHKTFSGGLMFRQARMIKQIIDRFGCLSVLDYGCGKGKQYITPMEDGRLIEDFWGIDVKKYDPAWPAYAAEPTGRYDLVICTHVMGSIPSADVPWAVGRLYDFASKVVYFAERIGPVKKRVFRNQDVMPRGLSPEDWIALVRPPAGADAKLIAAFRNVPDQRGWQCYEVGAEIERIDLAKDEPDLDTVD